MTVIKRKHQRHLWLKRELYLTMWKEAVFATFLIFFVLGIMSFAERAVRLRFYPDPSFEKETSKPARSRAKKNAE